MEGTRGRAEGGIATAGVQDTMMNVIALSGWQTLGLLDFYQLLLLLLLLLLLALLLVPLLLFPAVARNSQRALTVPRGDFSRNSRRNYTRRTMLVLSRVN